MVLGFSKALCAFESLKTDTQSTKLGILSSLKAWRVPGELLVFNPLGRATKWVLI